MQMDGVDYIVKIYEKKKTPKYRNVLLPFIPWYSKNLRKKQKARS